MLNNKDSLLLSLRKLGLTTDESKVYLTLLDGSMSHLEIARKTGVNRTKVYRIVDNLVKRGLITETLSDRGRELAANSPENLEIVLTTEEERLGRQKAILKQAMPTLQELFSASGKPEESAFVVNTYQGIDGFKQMLWNELKTRDEIVIFGSGSIKDLISNQRWAEKHRERTIEAGYSIREVLNLEGARPNVFTENGMFMKRYSRRYIDKDILPLAHPTCIYNDTVAIYSWRNNQKIGTEIINQQYADMLRAIFEQYWAMAEEVGE